MFGSVDHNGCESIVYAFFTNIEIFTVIQVECNVQTSIEDRSLYQFDQISRLGIFSGSGGYLKDQRSLLFRSGLYDTLDDFHVVDIESTYCVVAVQCILKHFLCSN